MSYDEYLLELDELETALKNLTATQAMSSVLLKKGEADIMRLEMHYETFTNALAYSKKKAKIVDLQEFVNTRDSLDKCKSAAYDVLTENKSNKKKHTETTNMIKLLNNKIKSLKELEKEYGKVLHYDFRGNSGTTTKR